MLKNVPERVLGPENWHQLPLISQYYIGHSSPVTARIASGSPHDPN